LFTELDTVLKNDIVNRQLAFGPAFFIPGHHDRVRIYHNDQPTMPFIPLIALAASLAFGTPTALSETISDEASKNPETMAAYVRVYFADEPILADIAWCESRMRQTRTDGEVMRGKIDRDDIGVMQINTRFHGKKAKEMDLDLHSLGGNLEYAKYLYDKEGTKPWLSSSACWGKLVKK
jgi:hypothetical protein